MANRCCPYGCLTTLPILVCFVATLLTGIATFDCRFFEISAYDEMYDKRSIGLWTAETHNVDLYYDDDYTCVGWNEHSELSTDLFDASMRFGRAMSLLASLLSLIVLVSVFILTCVPVGKEGLKILACCHFLVALPTILMLVRSGSISFFCCTITSNLTSCIRLLVSRWLFTRTYAMVPKHVTCE